MKPIIVDVPKRGGTTMVMNLLKTSSPPPFTFNANEGHNLLLYTNLPANRCPITIFKPESKWVEKNHQAFA